MTVTSDSTTLPAVRSCVLSRVRVPLVASIARERKIFTFQISSVSIPSLASTLAPLVEQVSLSVYSPLRALYDAENTCLSPRACVFFPSFSAHNCLH